MDCIDKMMKERKENSDYIGTLVDGESFRGKLLSYQAMEGRWGATVRFTFELALSSGELKIKTWDCKNNKFFGHFKEAGIVPGMTFTITRSGVGPQTDYLVSDAVSPDGKKVDIAQTAIPQPPPRTIKVKPATT